MRVADTLRYQGECDLVSRQPSRIIVVAFMQFIYGPNGGLRRYKDVVYHKPCLQ